MDIIILFKRILILFCFRQSFNYYLTFKTYEIVLWFICIIIIIIFFELKPLWLLAIVRIMNYS